MVTTAFIDGRRGKVNFENVLYTPDIMKNLLSVSLIRLKGFQISFDDSESNKARGICTSCDKQMGTVKFVAHETTEGSSKVLMEVK